jgi:hypothetical protein
MSDTVALALIALFGSINVTIGLLIHQKVTKCGDKPCIDAVKQIEAIK